MAAESAPVKILIAYYSTWNHIKTLAESELEGAKSVDGVEVTIKRIAETLPEEVLSKMHAAPKEEEHEVLDPKDLAEYDGVIFGVPTRFGMMASQVKAMFDATGSLWQAGALRGKTAGIFVSTGTQGGGQETTALTSVTQFTHHGMIFVPFGYGFPSLQFDNSVAHGGTPYGAGTLAGPDGSAQPLEGELGMAKEQGKYFAETTKALVKGKSA